MVKRILLSVVTLALFAVPSFATCSLEGLFFTAAKTAATGSRVVVPISPGQSLCYIKISNYWGSLVNTNGGVTGQAKINVYSTVDCSASAIATVETLSVVATKGTKDVRDHTVGMDFNMLQGSPICMAFDVGVAGMTETLGVTYYFTASQ